LLSFATPAWLLGLLLVPVIRWLHRGGAQLRRVPVASLTLWRKAAVAGPSTGMRRPPDPVWRRRALAAALLAVALAGPRFAAPVERITLWVDDSLSMLTQESGGSRLETGLADVAAELAAQRRAEVEVRTLGNPWQTFDGLESETVTAVLAAAGQLEPSAPPAGLLHADRQHWLLTDGADPGLAAAVAEARFSRVFRVGELTRNVGLVRLIARRSLGERDRLDVALQVSNGGNAAEERVAVLYSDSGELMRRPLELEAGGTAMLSMAAPMSPTVRARLEPGDALAADDVLVLDASALATRRVAVDATCPSGLVAALQTHPALASVASGAPADLAVECNGAAAAISIPQIRFLRNRASTAVEGVVTWSSGVSAGQRRSLDASPLRTRGELAPLVDGDEVLLAAGPTPLILQRRGAGAPVIETTLDTESDALDRPLTPLLVAFLVDRAFSAALLDPVAVSAREERAVQVVPGSGVTGIAAASPTAARQGRDWTWPLLALAVLALLWELAALLRRWQRERVEAEAWPG
jgi:hypothetical protein